MEKKLITCPGNAHLAELEIERTSLGLLIVSCDHFDPPTCMTCERDCARRMDRREHDEIEAHTERVLVLCSSKDRRTSSIARHLATALAGDGLVAEIANADVRTAPAPDDYDAVAIGSRYSFTGYSRRVVEYIQRHRDALDAKPTFFFTTSRPRRPYSGGDLGGHAERIAAVTGGWRPAWTAAFSRMGRLRQWLFPRPPMSRADARRIEELQLQIADGIVPA